MPGMNTSSTDIGALVDLTYYAIGCVILSVVGLVGNSLLIFTVVRNKEMREKSHCLVTSLAFADWFTCVGIFLAAISTFVGHDKNISQWSCFWIQSLGIFWSSVDNLLICLIGIDRIIILRHALR
jgi:hypothetical protein